MLTFNFILALNDFLVLFWPLMFLNSSILVLKEFHECALTIECSHIFLVSSYNLTKSELNVILVKFFLYLLESLANEVQFSLKSGSKVSHLFHKIGYIYLISIINAMKLELSVTLN